MLRTLATVLVFALVAAPSPVASCAGCTLTSSSRERDVDTSDPLANGEAQSRTLAEALAEDADRFVRAVQASPWRAGYSMMKPGDSRRHTGDYRALKAQEFALRDRIAAYLSDPKSVATEVLFTYGDYVLFVEKRTSSAEDRAAWREHSGGDMFAGQFSAWQHDETLTKERLVAKELVPLKGAQLIGVPIVLRGRFVCAIYLKIVS